MLILLSPAKALDFETELPDLPHSLPRFAEQSEQLAGLMRDKKVAQIRQLSNISPALAELNEKRWQDWQLPQKPGEDCRQALFAFRGDVYLGFGARELTGDDLNWAQEHLRILSGLHGMLRPLDLIRPYRLEMGTALKNPAGKDLYALWRKRLTDSLAEELRSQQVGCLLNLASIEYASAIDMEQLQIPAVSPVFQSLSRSGWRQTMFATKRARGMMASWAIRNRLTSPDQLPDFAEAGYAHQPDLSTPEKPVFRLLKN